MHSPPTCTQWPRSVRTRQTFIGKGGVKIDGFVCIISATEYTHTHIPGLDNPDTPGVNTESKGLQGYWLRRGTCVWGCVGGWSPPKQSPRSLSPPPGLGPRSWASSPWAEGRAAPRWGWESPCCGCGPPWGTDCPQAAKTQSTENFNKQIHD